MAYICENLFNNEILLKSSSNGIIIKLGKKWILFHKI